MADDAVDPVATSQHEPSTRVSKSSVLPSAGDLRAEVTRLLANITPGEWAAHMPFYDDAHMCRITTDHDPRDGGGNLAAVRPVIGMTWHPEHVVSYVGLSRAECMANAALFAAAPRLLRALLASLAQVTQERDAYAGKLHRLQARTPERALAAAQAENARLKVAVDAADLLMAQFIGVELPTKAWQSWRSQHRQALCDPAPLPKEPTTP